MSILRNLFLGMSANAPVCKFVTGFPLLRRASCRFVAGETINEAIGVIKKLSARGIDTTLDQLGEKVANETGAYAAKENYIRALDAIDKNNIPSQVSLKLTQMGLDIHPDLCLANMRQILAHAKKIDTLVTIDMESSQYTRATLDIFRILREEYDNVGTVLQSYLFRSEKDFKALIALNANIRLCKGAYKEPSSVAFPQKKDVDANYFKLARFFFDSNGSANRAYLALATHDEKIIAWAKEYAIARDMDRNRFEFQMLYGIRPDLQNKIVKNGFRMRVYVPYGTHWYPYFMRRLAERPANVIFLAKNLLIQGESQ